MAIGNIFIDQELCCEQKLKFAKVQSLHCNALEGFNAEGNPLGTARGSEVWIFDDTDSDQQAINERDLAIRSIIGIAKEIESKVRTVYTTFSVSEIERIIRKEPEKRIWKEKDDPWPTGIPILKGATACPAVLLEMEFYDYSGEVVYDKRVKDAVAWALDELDSTKYAFKCLRFVWNAYELTGAKIPPLPYQYAKQAADALGAKDNPGAPPRGAYTFYDCSGTLDGEYRNWGHVGLSLGNGDVVHAFGKVRIDNYLDIQNLSPGVGWTKPQYVGWAYPPLTPPIKTYPNMLELMKTDIWQENAAQGIANGILGYFEGRGLTYIAKSPVDIVITDPDGLRISKQLNEIPGATYTEVDLDGDGDLDDLVRIPDRKLGDYLIAVAPEPSALPTDTYTLEVSLFGEVITIAENVQISDIPVEPYVVISSETGITLPAPPDTTPPMTTFASGSPKYIDLGGNIYVTSDSPLTLSATDDLEGTGVAYTAYRIRNATYDSYWTTYATWFYLTALADDTYYIEYNSTDNIGNTEPTNTATVILDNTPPTTTLTIGEPKYILGITYVTPDTPFTLGAGDTGSGVSTTAYQIYGGTYDSDWLIYTGPLNLSSLTCGNCTIAFNSTDNAGNVENTNYFNVTLVGPDFNGDGEVDMHDIALAARTFGSYRGHPRWNQIVDINLDGKVNLRDIALVARKFGKHYS